MYSYGNDLRVELWSPSITKTWKDVCHSRLTSPEHVKLRERLLQLEELHGPAIWEHIPL